LTGRAIGVDVGDGVRIGARRGVISGAGIHATKKLLPNSDMFVGNVKPGISHIMLFIGMQGTAEELDLPTSNMWSLPVDKEYGYSGIGLTSDEAPMDAKDPWKDVDVSKLLLFVGFPRAKDGSWSERFPNKSTCEIVTNCPTSWFDLFANESAVSGKRKNVDYNRMKSSIESKIMERFNYFRNAKGK